MSEVHQLTYNVLCLFSLYINAAVYLIGSNLIVFMSNCHNSTQKIGILTERECKPPPLLLSIEGAFLRD